MIYKSKISPVIWMLFSLIMGILVIIYAINGLWNALAVSAIIVGFVTHLIVTTRYTVTGNNLNVHSGFFINTDIDIASIKSIAATRSVLSAPALSFDRIEIFYNRYDSIVISPLDKTQFIAHLLSINSRIQIQIIDKN